MKAETTPPLRGTVALVTGARGGIGRAACEALSEAGARVVASGRGNAPEDLRADAWLQHEVTSADDWASVVAEIQSRFQRLDCLINNAGITVVKAVADTSLEEWRRVLSVNVESVLLGLQAALPLLKLSGTARKGGSSVVNVSSVAGLRGSVLGAAYSASKGAMTLLSRTAAREFASFGYPIRVNTVHPAGVETQMTESILRQHVERGFSTSTQHRRSIFEAAHPLGRMAQPEEIASGIVFLCSSAASFMTGAELIIDGGVMA